LDTYSQEELSEYMEKATESNVSNTGKARNEWWRKRREEPRKVRAKVFYGSMVRRRQKSSARPKRDRYAAALSLFFATNRLRKLIQNAAKTGGIDGINKARIRMGMKPVSVDTHGEDGL
jgi:hypothetical protein